MYPILLTAGWDPSSSVAMGVAILCTWWDALGPLCPALLWGLRNGGNLRIIRHSSREEQATIYDLCEAHGHLTACILYVGMHMHHAAPMLHDAAALKHAAHLFRRQLQPLQRSRIILGRLSLFNDLADKTEALGLMADGHLCGVLDVRFADGRMEGTKALPETAMTVSRVV